MGEDMRLTSIESLLAKIYREVGYDNLEPADVIEYAAEALSFIGVGNQYEEAVQFAKVEDFRTLIPHGALSIIQIARNKCSDSITETKDVLCEESDVVEETEEEESNDCDDFITLSDNAFDLDCEYYVWTRGSHYGRCYQPVRLADHSFFHTIVCKEKDQSIYDTCEDEYTIQDPYLKFSFQEGVIAIAYTRQVTDDNGLPKIPDNPSYMQAITAYVRLKETQKRADKGVSHAMKLLQKYEQDWHWYCKQAGNSYIMPNTIDEQQNLLDQKMYLLPRQHEYFSYFGRLSKPELRKYNLPKHRLFT